MTQYLTWEECLARFPRLVRAMQWTACLSSGEAACAIRDYRGARMGIYPPELMLTGGEAVDHYGGSLKVILNAKRCAVRGIVRALHKGHWPTREAV